MRQLDHLVKVLRLPVMMSAFVIIIKCTKLTYK